MEKSLKEIWKEEMKRMPIIETAEGEIYLQPSDDGKFIEYGSITNSGILVDGEFEYDFDHSLDANIQAVAEEIFDKFGYPDFDESKKRRNESEEKTYYLYAGYHELFLTDHKLRKPFMYQAENTDLNELINDNLSDTDEEGGWTNPEAAFNIDDAHLLIDKNIMSEIDDTDMFSGLVSRMLDVEDIEEQETAGFYDLSEYYETLNESKKRRNEELHDDIEYDASTFQFCIRGGDIELLDRLIDEKIAEYDKADKDGKHEIALVVEDMLKRLASSGENELPDAEFNRLYDKLAALDDRIIEDTTAEWKKAEEEVRSKIVKNEELHDDKWKYLDRFFKMLPKGKTKYIGVELKDKDGNTKIGRIAITYGEPRYDNPVIFYNFNIPGVNDICQDKGYHDFVIKYLKETVEKYAEKHGYEIIRTTCYSDVSPIDESKKRRNENDEEIDDEFFIPVKIIFDGTVIVKADNEEEAKRIAEDNVTANLGSVGTNLMDIDYDIDMHGYCYADL